jgi:hypothetical protein
MLPVYEAISFNRIIDQGGRTKPWIVYAQTEIGAKPYVVKLFTPEEIITRNSVECEVIGNVMAREFFELPALKSALVTFSPDFIWNLPHEALVVYEQRDNRIYFATELIDTHIPFDTASIPKDFMLKRIDIDTLFAFDNLIRNRDRDNYKPNILLGKAAAHPIDHELAFDKIDVAHQNLIDGVWDAAICENHIFKSYLRRAMKATKVNYFDTFEEYLRIIDVNKLKPYFAQLRSYGYQTREQLIIPYLDYAKQNCSTFTKLLRGLV